MIWTPSPRNRRQYGLKFGPDGPPTAIAKETISLSTTLNVSVSLSNGGEMVPDSGTSHVSGAWLPKTFAGVATRTTSSDAETRLQTQEQRRGDMASPFRMRCGRSPVHIASELDGNDVSVQR